MGAQWFRVIGQGDTAEMAFRVETEKALYEYGHGGYTGTIAEKGEFVIMPVPAEWVGRENEYGQNLSDELELRGRAGDSPAGSKWGPAICFQLSPTSWLFCGWASS